VIAALVAGLLAGYGIAIPVGAVATYLLALTARTSLKIGAAAALGVATADGLYALLAALGGTELARAIQPIMLPLRWASILVLLALAAKTAATAISHHRSPTSTAANTPPSPTRAYASLLGITLLNPTTMVYFAALVLASQPNATPDRIRQALFVLGAFAASASWQLLLAAGGALLGKALTSDRGRLLTALASSALITILALRLLAAL
jgi:arginine exporter protein ArgO